MPVRRTRFAVCLSVSIAATACGLSDDRVRLMDNLDQRQSAIVNGQIDLGHPAVGAISYGGSLCTATLVGKYTVITAAHCVIPGRDHFFLAENRYWTAKSVVRHPEYSSLAADNDIALVRLLEAPPVQPAAISSKAPTVGQSLTLYGYGATSSDGNGSGTKRKALNTVAYVTPTRIVISGSGGQVGNMCFGDSGGPTFAVIDGHEVQVGVHSTIAGYCGQQGHDMRVDVFSGWVEEASEGDVAIDGRPSPLFDTTPPRVKITNPQAGGDVPFRFRLSAEITDDSGVARAELRVDGVAVEERLAPPFEFDLELAAGPHQLVVMADDNAGNRGQAVATIKVLEPLAFGDTCTESNECLSGICGVSGQRNYCTELCQPTVGACPLDANCLPAGGDAHACGPPPVALDPTITGDEPGNAPGSGGCALAADRSAPLPLLLLIGLIALRRRSR